MWATTLIVQEGQVQEAGWTLAGVRFRPPPAPPGVRYGVLVQVGARDWFGQPVAYTSLQAVPFWLADDGWHGWCNPGQVLAQLGADETALLRAWLQQRSARAWRAALPAVRTLCEAVTARGIR